MGTISPLCHDGAELDSTLRIKLLGFLKHIFSFIILYTTVVYQNLLHEIGFELEHGAGGQNPEGPEILCMILRSISEAIFGNFWHRVPAPKVSETVCSPMQAPIWVCACWPASNPNYSCLQYHWRISSAGNINCLPHQNWYGGVLFDRQRCCRPYISLNHFISM